MDKRQFKKQEKVLYIILILFSILFISESYKISGSKLTISSPGAFPIFISVMLLIFSIWIFLEKPHTSDEDKNAKVNYQIFNKDLIMIIILLLLYGIILKWFGFILSTFVFLWISISFLSKERYLVNLGISILTITIIMTIFNTVFKVTLP